MKPGPKFSYNNSSNIFNKKEVNSGKIIITWFLDAKASLDLGYESQNDYTLNKIRDLFKVKLYTIKSQRERLAKSKKNIYLTL